MVIKFPSKKKFTMSDNLNFSLKKVMYNEMKALILYSDDGDTIGSIICREIIEGQAKQGEANYVKQIIEQLFPGCTYSISEVDDFTGLFVHNNSTGSIEIEYSLHAIGAIDRVNLRLNHNHEPVKTGTFLFPR